MTEEPSYFTQTELEAWQRSLELANYRNIWCHCRKCEREWVASEPEACVCGSKAVEAIACWQFPDD